MRVRYTSDHGGRRAGVHELSEEQGRAAIEAGHAEEVESAPAATDAKGKPGMRVWVRHAVTIDGTDYGANGFAFVPVTDEAWQAVSNGHADLNPPPGERLANGVQPFPPEWVNRDETTEAPAPRPPVVATVAGPADMSDPAKGKDRTPAARKATPDTIARDPHHKGK